MTRTIRHLLAALASASGLGLAPAAGACDTPDGMIEFSGGALAAGVGYAWGRGTLQYQGRTIPITVKGLSVLALGGGAIEASGVVCNLAKLQEFDGDFTAVSAGATLPGGHGITTMENRNGVVISLRSTTQGLHFNVSLEGVAIRVAVQ